MKAPISFNSESTLKSLQKKINTLKVILKKNLKYLYSYSSTIEKSYSLDAFKNKINKWKHEENFYRNKLKNFKKIIPKTLEQISRKQKNALKNSRQKIKVELDIPSTYYSNNRQTKNIVRYLQKNINYNYQKSHPLLNKSSQYYQNKYQYFDSKSTLLVSKDKHKYLQLPHVSNLIQNRVETVLNNKTIKDKNETQEIINNKEKIRYLEKKQVKEVQETINNIKVKEKILDIDKLEIKNKINQKIKKKERVIQSNKTIKNVSNDYKKIIQNNSTQNIKINMNFNRGLGGKEEELAVRKFVQKFKGR